MRNAAVDAAGWHVSARGRVPPWSWEHGLSFERCAGPLLGAITALLANGALCETARESGDVLVFSSRSRKAGVNDDLQTTLGASALHVPHLPTS